MGWNEPPGGNKGKDPWGNRGGSDGPPDLDEIVRKMQQGLGGLFGKRPGSVGNGGSPLVWILAILIIVVIAAADMVYFIDEQERGVVLRFGEYKKTLQQGFNVRLPTPIDEIIMVNVGQVNTVSRRASMLTEDINIVDVEVAVQWRINEPKDFIFNVLSPVSTLEQAAESAAREVIGKSKLDYVMTKGRADIEAKQQVLIQEIMDQYKAGILILSVDLQSVKPPEAVADAFEDAIKAEEDEKQLINKAEAYRNDIIPKARGRGARLREEANAYKATVIAKAEGEASRFEQLLAEYERAPSVTRQRLYLDSIESVLSRTNKVLLDTEGNNSLLYLPIDRLIDSSKRGKTLNIPEALKPEPTTSFSTEDIRDRLDSRTRETR